MQMRMRMRMHCTRIRKNFTQSQYLAAGRVPISEARGWSVDLGACTCDSMYYGICAF